MIRRLIAISLLVSVAAPLGAPALAQDAAIRPIAGTRLDIAAAGEVRRVPDIVTISAGVMTQAPSAVEAIRQNAERMAAVRRALERAGIAARDIQTSNVSLHPEYRYQENQPPQLVGYRASNQVNVRFRDIAASGRILDALVAQGANQINGPMLGIDRPEAALDEARTTAIANARARAELYARALGMRVIRVLSVSEGGAMPMPPVPMLRMQAADAGEATSIEPGEQVLSVTVTVSFELQ
jgi:uncharacterized protein YggE